MNRFIFILILLFPFNSIAQTITNDPLLIQLEYILESFDKLVLSMNNRTIEEKSCVYKLHKETVDYVKLLMTKIETNNTNEQIPLNEKHKIDIEIFIMKLKTINIVYEKYKEAKLCKMFELRWLPEVNYIPVSSISNLNWNY